MASLRNKAIEEIQQQGESIKEVYTINFYLPKTGKRIRPKSYEVTAGCENDLLLVTNDNLYIYEDYLDIERLPLHIAGGLTGWCTSTHTGDAALEPLKSYKYPINKISSINGIEYVRTWAETFHELAYKDGRLPYPHTFSIQFNEPIYGQDIIFIDVNPYDFTGSSPTSKEDFRNLFDSLLKGRDILVK